jgi:hypothetical protein
MSCCSRPTARAAPPQYQRTIGRFFDGDRGTVAWSEGRQCALWSKSALSSVTELVETEHSCIWTLGSLIDEAQANLLHEEAERELRPFVQPDGSVAFAMPALIVTAARPN